MKLVMLINFKIPTFVGILTSTSMTNQSLNIHETRHAHKRQNTNNFWHYNIHQHDQDSTFMKLHKVQYLYFNLP